MNSRIARRYAQSLVDLALERQQLDAVYADAQLILHTIEENRDLKLLLSSPIVKTDKKLNILSQIFTGKVSEVFMAFIKLITQKGREKSISAIAREVIAIYKTKNSILTAEVTTAVKMDDNLRTQVKNIVKQLGPQVDIIEKIDPSIIGGFIIRIGDRQIDSSISGQLADLRKEFEKNPIYAQ